MITFSYSMSLTKKDLDKVCAIINNCFETYVKPLHHWSIEINKKIESMDVNIKGLSQRMDDHVFHADKNIIANAELIGKYLNDFVTQKTFGKLEKRVHKLEFVAA